MGEYDAGAVAGGNVTTLVDSVGTENLGVTGSGMLYSSSVDLNAFSRTASSLSLYVPGGGTRATGAVITGVYTNFGIEGWFYTASSGGTQVMAYNGNPGNSGWGFGVNGGNWEIFYGGVAFQTIGPATFNTWNHVALVQDSNTAT